jgi:phosphatidylglycerophosphate synthase
MEQNKFTGDKKAPMKTFLAAAERKFIDRNVTKIPKGIETYHLTLTTLLWSAGVIVFGWLAKNNLHWLWLSSLMLVLQWFTDAFDGAVGRHRNTGLLKWGFFMDHLLDFVFMACIFIGYSFLLTGFPRDVIFLLIGVFGTFMVSSFLSFGATGEFKITYLGTGPTEIRIWFIVLNTVLIFCGTKWIEKLMLPILIISIFVLFVVIFRTQKYIWQIDMQDKANRPK